MRFSLLLLSALAIQACASPDDAPVTEPATDPVAETVTEPTTDLAAPTTYQCESGQTVVASYPTTDTAVVEYNGQTTEMTIDVSGSGTRYVGDELEWWTEGTDEGTLFRHNADGTSGDLVETCTTSV